MHALYTTSEYLCLPSKQITGSFRVRVQFSDRGIHTFQFESEVVSQVTTLVVAS
jgi:hypothetical protein